MKFNIDFYGEITFVDFNQSKNGNTYAKGFCASYVPENGKKKFFTSFPFMAFGDQAVELEVAGLKKGDMLEASGQLNQNNFNDETYHNFVIRNIKNIEQDDAIEPPSQEEAFGSQTSDSDNGLEFDDDDFPFN
jgi:hypothetical protein